MHSETQIVGNLSKLRKKIFWIAGAVFAVIVGAGVYSWPLWLDSDPRATARLILNSRSAEAVPLASIFGPAKLYCAIGPYDSFQSPRFRAHLSVSAQQKLDAAVNDRFSDGQSDNQFILAGLDDERILFVYRSLFLDKTSLASVGLNDCVDASGYAVVARVNRTIYIRQFGERGSIHKRNSEMDRFKPHWDALVGGDSLLLDVFSVVVVSDTGSSLVGKSR